MLNMWIKESVVSHVTEDQIKKFIRRINFTQHVKRQLETVQHRFRKDDVEHLKYIDTDKELIKAYLREKIGTTFQECTAPSNENLLDVDVKDWGGLRGLREHTPWKQSERAMTGITESMCVGIWVSCALGIIGCSLETLFKPLYAIAAYV